MKQFLPLRETIKLPTKISKIYMLIPQVLGKWSISKEKKPSYTKNRKCWKTLKSINSNKINILCLKLPLKQWETLLMWSETLTQNTRFLRVSLQISGKKQPQNSSNLFKIILT